MNEVLVQGLTAMALGMGVVLTFLVMLIVSMSVMSNIVSYLNKIFPEVIPAPAKSKAKKSASAGKEDEQVALAIAIAMSRA